MNKSKLDCPSCNGVESLEVFSTPSEGLLSDGVIVMSDNLKCIDCYFSLTHTYEVNLSFCHEEIEAKREFLYNKLT